MGIYAVIRIETASVENIVVWDGTPESGWGPPDGCIAIECPEDLPVTLGWSYSEGVFIPPEEPEPNPTPLPLIAEAKRIEIRSACSDEITRSSFQSSALGAVHNYDCRIVDQINLKMRLDVAEASGSSEPLWASDGTRYQWKAHTSEEILDVMIDMNDHIKSSQVKLASLMAAVDAATTKLQIDAIVW